MTPQDIQKQIKGLRKLRPNWDSYGAPKISERAITWAMTMAPRFGHGAKFWPRANGGIEIEWVVGSGCVLTAEIDP